MPNPFIKKVAKKIKSSPSTVEKEYKAVEKSAKKQGYSDETANKIAVKQVEKSTGYKPKKKKN